MHDADWFKARYARLGLTQDDLGSTLGCDRSVASRIVNGEQQLRLDQVMPLARALDVSPFEILFRAGMWGDQPPRGIQSVAVIGEIEAGEFVEPPTEPPVSSNNVIVEYPRNTLFALVVRGDSMDNVAPEGSVVVVDYQRRDLSDGQLGVFRQEDGAATFKRYRTTGAETWLQPDSDNPRHSAIFPREGQRIEIIGRVVDIRPEHTSESDVIVAAARASPSVPPLQVSHTGGRRRRGPLKRG